VSNKLVIIPTYNERENIHAMVRKVLSLPANFHLLVVDDSSPDGTGQIVKELQKEFPQTLFLLERLDKDGLGKAYIAGFKWAFDKNYEFVFEIDCDFSHNPDDLMKLAHACEMDNFDVAVGSRYVTGVNVVNWPMKRVMLSYFASMYVRFITGLQISDSTAGFVCYKTKVLKTINIDKIRFKGYAFQIEMKFKAWKYGFKITEVPIIFTDRTLGTSKMSKGIVWEALIGVISLKINSWFQKYPKN